MSPNNSIVASSRPGPSASVSLFQLCVLWHVFPTSYLSILPFFFCFAARSITSGNTSTRVCIIYATCLWPVYTGLADQISRPCLRHTYPSAVFFFFFFFSRTLSDSSEPLPLSFFLFSPFSSDSGRPIN